MEGDTRQQLGRMLRRERCRPVIDETLVELNLDGATMPPPFAAGQEDAITIGSASKSFWGGLRIGWIRAPHALVRPLVESPGHGRSGRRGDRAVGARGAAHRRGRDLDRAAEPDAGGRDHLMRLLVAELPEWRVAKPGGGQTAMGRARPPVSSELTAAAAAHGVIITPGHRFFPNGGGQRHLRLPFAAPPAVLTVAVTRLRRPGAAWTRPGPDCRRRRPYDLTA